jgi:hypothetical protein
MFNRRGWPETANTWEPLHNLQSVPDLIHAFEERYFILLINPHLLYVSFISFHFFFFFLISASNQQQQEEQNLFASAPDEPPPPPTFHHKLLMLILPPSQIHNNTFLIKINQHQTSPNKHPFMLNPMGIPFTAEEPTAENLLPLKGSRKRNLLLQTMHLAPLLLMWGIISILIKSSPMLKLPAILSRL